jgi:hypothetical protein
LRNRSTKEIKIDPELFKGWHDETEILGAIYPENYGFCTNEPLKGLGYKEKSSQDYNVDHDVRLLAGQTNRFETFESKFLMKENSHSESPLTIGPLKIRTFKIVRSVESTYEGPNF